ncbi:MAG: DJ-1/PfpI family protein [Victivallaceae bacterium]|nr:DJ-1/PfpI family protein [Victivallaceae bacterium]
MKVLAIVADGAEDIETVGVIDVLRRLGVETVAAGLDSLEVTASNGSVFKLDTRLDDVIGQPFDAVYLPGGNNGAMKLYHSDKAVELLKKTHAAGGAVAAICAAPIVLAKAGLLDGRHFTMYPGYDRFLAGNVPTGNMAEVDGRVVTGKGPGAVFHFAAALAGTLGFAEKVKTVYAAMFIKL